MQGTPAVTHLPEPGHLRERTKLINPAGYSTQPPPSDRPVRIFVHGVFDLFHAEYYFAPIYITAVSATHVHFLKVTKNIFPETYLIAGVTTDNDTLRVKGLTVISAASRAEVVRGCKYVDEVVQDCEPVLTPEFMKERQIDYFAHSDTVEPDPYRFVKEDGKFLVVPRVKDGESTTQIISRVLRNRDKYVLRQLKNGASLKDMKITWLKLQWIKICSKVA
ncbi:unnamed protein product [Clonostachys rhizophaga]|uniref:choline-phosphate cytidylyltransferase n=1 Tax=Clonostachys rhizophaga TaxID=160324 RepID=A0A9N9YM41_9HYPO|nr:unnamed protein product [Clonostachys rhizophaga]